MAGIAWSCNGPFTAEDGSVWSDIIVKVPSERPAEMNDEARVMELMNRQGVPCIPTRLYHEEDKCLMMSRVGGSNPLIISKDKVRELRKNWANEYKKDIRDGSTRDVTIATKIREMLQMAKATGVQGHDAHPGNFLVPNTNAEGLKQRVLDGECPVYMIDLPEYTWTHARPAIAQNPKSQWYKSCWRLRDVFGSVDCSGI
jgi:hypothetical protein